MRKEESSALSQRRRRSLIPEGSLAFCIEEDAAPLENTQTVRISVAEADRQSTQAETFTRGHMVFLSAVLCFYYSIIAICISPDGYFKTAIYPYMKPIADCFSLRQAWNLFSPEVRTTNGHQTAIITFADGSLKFYEFPRMEKLDFFGKLKREKLRKMFIDNLPTQGFEQFRPSVARALARANNDRQNPPVLVTLQYHWVNTPPPENWLYRDKFPEHVNHGVELIYKVRPEDLR